MKIEIFPGRANGIIDIPPSKSISHRKLICAALSEGKSIIHNVSSCDDVLATAECLRQLGATIAFDNNHATVTGNGALCNGRTDKVFNCNESASTLRFLLPICLSRLSHFKMTASKGLLDRPIDVYRSVFSGKSISIDKLKDGYSIYGNLQPGCYKIQSDISSQFVSGLLFALPMLPKDSEIILSGETVSRPYIDLTLESLCESGITVEKDNNTFYIPGNQKYKDLVTNIEGDWSNAAFFIALNEFGGGLSLTGISDRSKQGDRVIVDYFKRLKEGAPVISIRDCPDLAPILIAAASVFNGCTLADTSRLSIKESDRGHIMANELKKFGIKINVENDKISVLKSAVKKPTEELYSHGDHRIAMSLAIMLTLTGGVLNGAESVSKSMPDFFDLLSSVGIKITELK